MIDKDRLITDWILPVIAVTFLFSFFKASVIVSRKKHLNEFSCCYTKPAKAG